MGIGGWSEYGLSNSMGCDLWVGVGLDFDQRIRCARGKQLGCISPICFQQAPHWGLNIRFGQSQREGWNMLQRREREIVQTGNGKTRRAREGRS